MSASKKPVDKLAALAAMRKDMVADEPPVIAAAVTTPPPPSAVPLKPRAAQSGKAAKPADTDRERTAVNLSGRAMQALKQLQAFLITDCGATATSASAAMCIALEHTAKGLPGNKRELVELYEENRQDDKRRRPAE